MPHDRTTGDQKATGSDLALGLWGGALTDALNDTPAVSAYFKDHHRRFVWCNDSLAKMVGRTTQQDLLGMRDEDLAPPDLAAEYRTHEEQVLGDGQRLIGLIELVRRSDGSSAWYLSTKSPVRGPDGDIIGLVGVSRPLAKQASRSGAADPMLQVATYISGQIHRRLTVAALAAEVAMSPGQFSKMFKRRFRVTPHQYVRRVRIATACDLLATTDRPLVAIASATGYADQSHFSNDFSRARGMTPSDYRRQFGTSGHQVLAG